MKVNNVIPFDVEAVRRDFPILGREVNGQPLIYLDNGATSQKPQSVIDTIDRYYSDENSNIHRGVHHLSQMATQAYEDAREDDSRVSGRAAFPSGHLYRGYDGQHQSGHVLLGPTQPGGG